MPRALHIVQGLSAAGSFVQAMHPAPGELLAHEDVLSCGPLPAFKSFEQWTSVRQAFWDSVTPSSDRWPLKGDIGANPSALCDAESITLWLGTGVAEQLLLAWLIQVLKVLRSKATLRLVQFSQVGERKMEVLGLGMLNPERIKCHPPVQDVSGDTMSALDCCWQAITAPDPAEFVSALRAEHTGVHLLRAGLQTLVRRYPDYRTGLGIWDQELLKQTKEYGPSVVRVIGHTLGLNIHADLVGDQYLFSRLRRLASSDCAQPLLNISGDTEKMRTCEVSLTEAGYTVLEGRGNAVEMNGIDDWVLGVHLSSKGGTVWYQKEGTIVGV